ncbi:hypothetical protein FB567DRAFT_13522 [Paraphoma chrysanthemicola]|uniref:Homeobox domain-containing protein n=1 Tax=Paraphoma chrysanthemicola TaxID=798071 RepID=A0A8K0W4D9_9PLEO|nr:hypothetical protein FB567DRAFT_13522 [Paraphoma chrysanthemicola]
MQGLLVNVISYYRPMTHCRRISTPFETSQQELRTYRKRQRSTGREAMSMRCTGRKDLHTSRSLNGLKSVWWTKRPPRSRQRRKNGQLGLLQILNKAFAEKRYLSRKETNKLASKTGTDYLFIDGWFQTTRRLGPKTVAKHKTSDDQWRVLKAEFDKNPKPTKHTRIRLAREVGLQEPQVYSWFVNRRNAAKITPAKRISREQSLVVDQAFANDPKLSVQNRAALANRLGLPRQSVDRVLYRLRDEAKKQQHTADTQK